MVLNETQLGFFAKQKLIFHHNRLLSQNRFQQIEIFERLKIGNCLFNYFIVGDQFIATGGIFLGL